MKTRWTDMNSRVWLDLLSLEHRVCGKLHGRVDIRTKQWRPVQDKTQDPSKRRSFWTRVHNYFVLQFLKRCFTLQVTYVSQVYRSFFVSSYLSLIWKVWKNTVSKGFNLLCFPSKLWIQSCIMLGVDLFFFQMLDT